MGQQTGDRVMSTSGDVIGEDLQPPPCWNCTSIPCVNVTVRSHCLGLLQGCVTVISQSMGTGQGFEVFGFQNKSNQGMWVTVKMEGALLKTSKAWEITLYNKMPAV